MQRFGMVVAMLVVPSVAALAVSACNVGFEQELGTGLQTAAPTLQAAGTQAAAAMGTAGPTIDAAKTQIAGGLAAAGPTLRAAATQMAAGLATARPTIEAAGTELAGGLATARSTLEAAGTQVAGGLGTARPTLLAAGTRVAGAIASAQPTLAAAGTELAGAVGTAAGGFASSGVVGPTWAWQGTRMNDGTDRIPADPAAYTVRFNRDGSVDIKADCNTGGGTYTADAGELTITVGRMTRAACPPPSLHDAFLRDLGEVSAFLVRDGTLHLALELDSGSMTFEAAP